MWKVGDIVQKKPGIFQNEKPGMALMTITHIQYPRGRASGWPLEIVTELDGRYYRWKPEALQEPHMHLNTRKIFGGSSWA